MQGEIFTKNTSGSRKQIGSFSSDSICPCSVILHSAHAKNKKRAIENTLNKIKQMFHLLHVMVSIFMSPSNPYKVDIDGHVKVFLLFCSWYSHCYCDKREVRFWAKPGNFSSLFCLAGHRKRHDLKR